MATNLHPGEVTYGIGTASYGSSAGALWLTNRRLLHVSTGSGDSVLDASWPAHTLSHAVAQPGARSSRVTIHRHDDRPLVFKRTGGCHPIVEAVNRTSPGPAEQARHRR